MNTARICVKSAANILAYVPHTLGFAPRESLVLLTMHGKQPGATLRIDSHQHSTPAEFPTAIVDY